MDKNKKIDRTNLSLAEIGQLDTLTALQDIAAMFQEVIHLYDSSEKKESDTTSKLGAILVDMRDQLTALNAKEQAEMPDNATPIVTAVSKLEKTISSALKSINVQPIVNVDAPQVNVEPTPVDLKGIEKILKRDIPAAFKEAIRTIPPPEKDDYSPLLYAWEGISQQLLSIENATRMKPLPGSMKVTNTDGSPIGSGTLVREKFDYISRALLADTVTEVYQYRVGGSLGTLVATVSVLYSDSSLSTFVSATRT